jgi:hypothetical protein
MKNNPEFDKFDSLMGKVLSVSRDELKRREEEWRKEHPKPERKRKPKTSASGRASRDKG